jgi:hypothetical protein
MICIDIQGEEHHCREKQEIVGFWGIPTLNRNNQPIEMHVLTNLKDTVAMDARIGNLPIGTRHSTKLHAISRPGFVQSEQVLRSPDFLRML